MLTLNNGEIGSFEVNLRDVSGKSTPSHDLTWISLQPGVAAVLGDGRVEAKHPGQATIRVHSPSVGAETEVTVIVRPVADDVALVARDELYFGTAGEPLPDSIEARVVDRGGLPVPGVAVSFSVAPGSGLVSPVVVQTDENGYARVEWTLGVLMGANAVEVSTAVPAAATGPLATSGPIKGPRKKLHAWGGAGEPSHVAVDPEASTLTIDEVERLRTVVTDHWGNVVQDAVIEWSSANESVASVDRSGSVRGRGIGKATVTARILARDDGPRNGPPRKDDVTANASVEVQPPGTGATLARAGGNGQTGAAGETLTQPLEVRLRDETGGISGVAVSWSVSLGGGSLGSQAALTDDDGIARVEWTLGPRTGRHEATAWVSGTSAVAFEAYAVAGSADRVIVSPSTVDLQAGQSMELAAKVVDKYHNPIEDRPVSWTTSDAGIAGIDVGGFVTAVSAGTALVSASLDGASGAATVNVTGGSSGGNFDIRIGPASDTLVAIGAHTDLTATVTDETGGAIAGANVEWASLDPEVATVDAHGRVTSRSVGVALITASLASGQADTATIHSRQIVASVSIEPSTVELVPGQGVLVTATASDALNVPVEGASYDWSVTDNEVAELHSGGSGDRREVVAVAPGTVTVLVESAEVAAVLSVTVDATPVAAVTVEPTSMTLAVDESATATAVARDEDGNRLEGREATWSSDDPTVASVVGGVVMGIGAGTTDVHAEVEGQRATLSVFVESAQTPPPPPVAVVEVTPVSLSIAVGQTAPLGVQIRAEDGAVLDRPVTWSSEDASVATVDQQGRVTGGAGGTTEISAESEGVAGSATVTVEASAPPPQVDVVLRPGQDIQQIVNSNPPGTVFGFERGTYYRLELTPRDGQVFSGGEGVVLDGQNSARFAFSGSSVGLHLKDLEITGYVGDGNGGQAAIVGWSGRDWTFENLYVHHNQTAGANPRNGGRVIGGVYAYNNPTGLVVNHATDVIIDGAELAYNNLATTQDPLWHAGGIKIAASTGVVVKNSHVHHNNGPGIWYDIDADDGVVENNVVEDNRYAGIFYEISQGCTIRGNRSLRNGFDNEWWHGAGVLLSDGANCLVEGNTVVGNRRGIIVLQNMRRPHGATNNTIVDNDIDLESGTTGFAKAVPVGVVFDRNRYVLPGQSTRLFRLNEVDVTWDQWRAAGYDTGGTAR